MHTNGDGELAQLRAEIAELRAALDIMHRQLATRWRARLLDLERDVDLLRELLGAHEDFAAAIEAYDTECRRARAAQRENDDAC